MSSYISKSLRLKVAKESRFRCGYCLSTEALTGIACEFDHLLPLSDDGLTVEDNLWLVCGPCNKHKSGRTSAQDPISKKSVRLFNPRHDDWTEHFVWQADGLLIFGMTAIGRATIAALQMNRELIVNARRRWIRSGWHPPKDC